MSTHCPANDLARIARDRARREADQRCIAERDRRAALTPEQRAAEDDAFFDSQPVPTAEQEWAEILTMPIAGQWTIKLIEIRDLIARDYGDDEVGEARRCVDLFEHLERWAHLIPERHRPVFQAGVIYPKGTEERLTSEYQERRLREVRDYRLALLTIELHEIRSAEHYVQ